MSLAIQLRSSSGRKPMSFIKPCHISVLSHTRRRHSRRETSGDASLPPFRIVAAPHAHISERINSRWNEECNNTAIRIVTCVLPARAPLNCNQAREIGKQWGARGNPVLNGPSRKPSKACSSSAEKFSFEGTGPVDSILRLKTLKRSRGYEVDSILLDWAN